MKTVAVLLTCHNRKEKTLKCLENLYTQNLPSDIELSVFLTDDGCTDGTAEAVTGRFPKVHIIKGDGTLFWNRGMRKAWEEAAKSPNDYYLWLNDDTHLLPNAISILLETSKKKNNESPITGTTQESETNPEINYGGRKLPNYKQVVPPDENSPIECDMFNGNIVLIPNSVFQKIGFNDNYYRHSFGDFDYGNMARKQNIKSYIAPGILGYCGSNNPVPVFHRKQYGLIERFKILYSPLGMNPIEDFHYQHKFHSLFYTVCHVIKLHLNIFLR